jgi:hypothetical protein
MSSRASRGGSVRRVQGTAAERRARQRNEGHGSGTKGTAAERRGTERRDERRGVACATPSCQAQRVAELLRKWCRKCDTDFSCARALGTRLRAAQCSALHANEARLSFLCASFAWAYSFMPTGERLLFCASLGPISPGSKKWTRDMSKNMLRVSPTWTPAKASRWATALACLSVAT